MHELPPRHATRDQARNRLIIQKIVREKDNRGLNVADEVIDLMRQRGSEVHLGEPVSQLEHALEAALIASEAEAPPRLIVAALLHDVGHRLHSHGESAASEGIDTRHEHAGFEWLLARFGPSVAEPVRDHVAAKRYRCAVDCDYFAKLSPASIKSLALQGRPFATSETRAFEQKPYWRDAVMLRRWDDAAKTPGIATPPLEHYRELLEQCAS
jgi:phosphonate degradation associated HDIG domain protein